MIYTMNQPNPSDRLLIFDNFQSDRNLPKFKNKDVDTSSSPTVNDFSSNIISSSMFSSSSSTVMIGQGGFIQYMAQQGSSQFTNNGLFANIYRKIKSFLKKRSEDLKIKYEEKHVKYVFDAVLSSPQLIEKFDENNNAYQKLIDNAKLLGQTALAEELQANLEVRKFENACIACDFNRALTERQLLTFADKCEKGLKLDWIKNFGRIIPIEALEKKLSADSHNLFDNYVILYYDPENRSTKLTEAEKEKLKDPILFGVMRGNRKLYFIHDWKDDLCDLTMEQVADVLGEKENLTLDIPKAPTSHIEISS
jgi:hypothetical protein